MLGRRIALWGLAIGLLWTSASAGAEPAVSVSQLVREQGLAIGFDPVGWAWNTLMWLYDTAAGLGFTLSQPSIDSPGQFGSQSV